jgi:tetratricopeptide (TPR) repeat protein
MVFGISESVPVVFKKTQKGFELVFKGIGLVDLGASLGEEASWKARFREIKDFRVADLRIQEISGGVQLTGRWQFPMGQRALANPVMETFEYREKDPLRYVVDFWLKPGPTKAQVAELRHKQQIIAGIQQAQLQEKKRLSRKIASLKHSKEKDSATTIKKYCEEPLSEQNDVFLKFETLHTPVNFSRWLTEGSADARFTYVKPQKKNKEAQYVRLAIDFYSDSKPGLAIRTLDFFNQDFPQSDFQLQMKFLRANAFLKLGSNQEAEKIFEQISQNYPKTDEAMYSTLYLSKQLMERKSYLQALEKFLWLIHYFPNHPQQWIFHLGTAECHFALKQTERAEKEYQWVMENAPSVAEQTEGAARMGDLYLSRLHYEQALGAYSRSEQYYRDSLKKFPVFYLNFGESLYQLGQFRRAGKLFDTFLAQYPSHPEGWRASFRLGEIEARMARQGASAMDARRWFYETINRYPLSIGAILARIRLAPCGDHGGFTEDAQEHFFSGDAQALPKLADAEQEIGIKDYENFRGLARMRTLVALGSPELVASVAMQEILNVSNPLLKKTFAAIANEYFRKVILQLLNSGKDYEALVYYRTKIPLMPPLDSAQESDYLLRLSRIAAEYQLGKVAQEVAKDFTNLEAREHLAAASMSTRSTFGRGTVGRSPSSIQHAFNEAAVSEDLDTEVQIKQSEKNFTQARALWIQAQDLSLNPPVAQTLRQTIHQSFQSIRDLLEGVSDESRFSYQKEIILGLMSEKEKDLGSAFVHIARAQLLRVSPRLTAWLASLEQRMGETQAALGLYQALVKDLSKSPSSAYNEDLEDSLGVPTMPTLLALKTNQAKIYSSQGRWMDAAQIYSEMMDTGISNSETTYQYASTLVKQGGTQEREKARTLLEKLVNSQMNDENEKFWKKLAFETLANMPRRGKNE